MQRAYVEDPWIGIRRKAINCNQEWQSPKVFQASYDGTIVDLFRDESQSKHAEDPGHSGGDGKQICLECAESVQARND